MTIKQTMTDIKDGLKTALLALLEAAGVPDFAAYIVGFPSDQTALTCCVRLAALKEKESLEFIIHLALPRLAEIDSYTYIQAVKDYLDADFDQSEYDFLTGTYSLDIMEANFTKGDIQAFFSVTLTRAIDDCD
jgi:hypothetical protein